MPEKILVVDDSEDSRRLIAIALRQAGYQVLEAVDGGKALKGAVEEMPDLILLDIIMPQMDGFTVCERLKKNERTADIPIIFLSALDDVKDKVKGLEVGGDDFISKPFDRRELLARASLQLKVRRLNREILRANQELLAKQKRNEEELQAAASMQRNLLRELKKMREENARLWAQLFSHQPSMAESTAKELHHS
jgi:DNA-binding response OmpR family regulator